MLPVLRDTAMMNPIATGRFNRLDSLFDRVFGDDGGVMGQAWSGAPMAMWEDENFIHIEAELPGFSDNDVEITVHNGMLFIRGERKPEQGRRYLYNGRSFGRFERAITLPEAVETEAVQATLTNGILGIDLPKSPEAKPKRIELKTG